jgi:hypothetical protein
MALNSLLVSGASFLIAVGLIATPTNCGCGIGTLHPHSLYLVPGHHHDSSGRHTRLGRAPGHHSSLMHASSPERGPRLAALRGHASERIAMVVAAFMSLSVLWRRLRWQVHNRPLPASHNGRPDTPPPRFVPNLMTS